MLLLLLASEEPAVGDLARRVLINLGFQVVLATADSPATLEFDYQRARFAVVAVADGASDRPDSIDEWPERAGPRRMVRHDLFAGVFQGVDAPRGLDDAIYIEPDEHGAWTDQLIETLRLLGWVSRADLADKSIDDGGPTRDD